MGVSIMMRPGTVMRSKGDPVNITPGLRSKAAAVIRTHFGESPVEIDRDHACTLALLANGATVFAADEDNLWKKMLDAVREHGCIVITMEY